MGQLHYGNAPDVIDVPDRILAHLRVLTTTKLRRSESFTVTWKHGIEPEVRRSTIWLHCSIPLRFEFDSAEAEQIDRDYLEELARSASAGGVMLDLTESAVETASLRPLELEKAA